MGGRDSFLVGRKIKERDLVAGRLIGCSLQEVVYPVADREGQEVLWYQFGLQVQVEQHLIQALTPYQLDDFAVKSDT